MVTINLWFNIVAVGLGTYCLGKTNVQEIHNVIRLICCLAGLYFTYDTYKEIMVLKRYIFVPHHLLSYIFVYKFYFIQDKILIRAAPFLLVCTETSSMIINVRVQLEKNKTLTRRIDIIFLIVYAILRNLIVTPGLYKIKQGNDLLWNSWLCILLMSNAWIIQWSKNIWGAKSQSPALKGEE